MYLENFKRYEKKYLIDDQQYRRLMALIYYKLEYDKYKKYKICNIYFDTPKFDLIRESIEKPIYKEKFRIRSYGSISNNDKVFIEIKKKYDGIVYKRRVCLPYDEAIDYCVNGNAPNYKTQIINEISWFLKKYEIYPMLYLSYDRIAMKGKEDNNLRITFDSNIRWRINNLDLKKGDFGETKVGTDKYVMEIKTSGAIPLWLSKILSDEKIFPQSYSKYGTIYKEELVETTFKKKEGIYYA